LNPPISTIRPFSKNSKSAKNEQKFYAIAYLESFAIPENVTPYHIESIRLINDSHCYTAESDEGLQSYIHIIGDATVKNCIACNQIVNPLTTCFLLYFFDV
jgi:hypothetical protein